jgi:hypothetical protein
VHLGHVAVRAACQDPGGGRVLLAVPDTLGELTDLRLQRGHAGLQIGRLIHERQPTARRRPSGPDECAAPDRCPCTVGPITAGPDPPG